jgi:hypothetical protein
MINEIMYAIGVEGKSIFEKAGSPFINDMITAISIKPTTKTGEVDAQATKKQTIFKHYADGYKKLVGVSSYPIRTIKAFYARAKQFVTAAENRGLLKTAGALVAATVIGGVAAKDIYDAKKLMADTDGTWKDAVKMGIRHTAGRPGRFAESAWENSKELGRKAKSTWDNRRSIAKNAWEKTKELAEKPGQKYREWQWNKALAAQDEADFNNRNRMNPEENYQNKEYGRKPSMKEKAKALYSKWRKKGKNNQQLEKDLEQENFNMMQENIQRGNEIRDRQEEITEKTLAKAINSLPNFRGYNDDEE